MKIDTREIDGILILDLSGSFPEKYKDQNDIEERFRVALAGSDNFIIVLHQYKSVEPKHFVFLLKWLHEAGCSIGGLGLGPYIRIVTDNDLVHEMFKVVDSSVRVYATEEEALAASA